MAYNIQEQVNSLEDQGIGALTQQLQHNPKLVVGIALENLQKDMQEAERAKQIGGGDTGLPIIDKKLASLSGGPSGQRDAMATASPGLQQRGQQLQGQQLLKSLFQAAKTPGGMPAAMAQAGGGASGMPTQRMAMGGIAGYQAGGKVQPIPALMDKYGSEMVMEFLEGEKPFRDAESHVAPENQEAYERDKTNFYSNYPLEFVNELFTSRSGSPYRPQPGNSLQGLQPLSGGPTTPEEWEAYIKRMQEETAAAQRYADIAVPMAHGGPVGIVGYANRGLVSGEDVDTERLLDAIRQVESGGNPNADSGYAYGAYQIGPEAGAQPGYGVEPIDVYNSTEEEQRGYARDYLKAMLGEFGGDLEPALQAYNVGPNALNQIRAGERDMPAETSDYYSKVMKEYGDRSMPQDEDFVPLASVAEDQGMVSKAVNWAKENPLEAASIGLMFVPGVGWGMAGARAGLMGARALLPRGIAAARQALGPGSRFGRAIQKPFTKPIMSGPGSAVRDPVSGQMMSAKDAAAFIKEAPRWLRGNPVMPTLNRAFSPGRTAGTVGAAGFAGANLDNLSPASLSGGPSGQQERTTGGGDAYVEGMIPEAMALTRGSQDRFREMFPDAEGAVERAKAPPSDIWKHLASQQAEKEAGASRGARYIGMQGDTQNMINRADPAATREDIDTAREFEAPNRGIMSQVPSQFRSNRDRFAEAIGPEAAEAIQQNQRRERAGAEPSEEYAPGIGGDAREIRDYLQRILGFKAGGRVGFEPGGTVEGEGVIPVNEGSDGMLKKAWGWAKENPALAASVGITLVAGGIMLGAPAGLAALGSLGMAGARALPAIARAAPSFLTGARTVAPAGGRLGRFGQKMFTKPRTSGAGSGVRGPTGQLMSGEAAKKAGLPAMRAFSPARTATYGGAATSAGLGLFGGSEDADAVQVQRDTSNLDPYRDFDTERLRTERPDVYSAFEEGARTTSDERRQRAQEGRKQAEEVFSREDRGGIMSRVGSALGSPQAQRFYSAMQDLGYGGGAPRGQEGTQMIRGLAARDAQNRELQALEDKVALEGEALNVQRQTSMDQLMGALWSNDSFQQVRTQLAAEMEKSIDDPEVIKRAVETFLKMIPQLSSALPVGGMPGLDSTPPNVEAARAIVGQ